MKFTKEIIHEIIFEGETRKGKIFDVVLLIVILISILMVLLESVPTIDQNYHIQLKVVEWLITLIFTAEYLVRIWVVRKPFRYIFSFYGIVDLLAVLPTYLSLFIFGSQSLVVIRAIRLLRVFRILKLSRYISAAQHLGRALVLSREKIFVFLFFILNIVTIVGTLMYLIEGPEHGFTSIPHSIYWAIVTITTVGYGDISPMTPLGQFLASIVMIVGYAIIAVPTGILTVGILSRSNKTNTHVCSNCMHGNHENDAVFCKKCGEKLN